MDNIGKKVLGWILIQQLFCVFIGLIAFIPDKCPPVESVECQEFTSFFELYAFTLMITFALLIFVGVILLISSKLGLYD